MKRPKTRIGARSKAELEKEKLNQKEGESKAEAIDRALKKIVYSARRYGETKDPQWDDRQRSATATVQIHVIPQQLNASKKFRPTSQKLKTDEIEAPLEAYMARCHPGETLAILDNGSKHGKLFPHGIIEAMVRELGGEHDRRAVSRAGAP